MHARDNNSLRHAGRMSLTKPLPYFVVTQCFEDLHVPRNGARILGGYHIAFIWGNASIPSLPNTFMVSSALCPTGPPQK